MTTSNAEHLQNVKKLRQFKQGDRVRVTWADGKQDTGRVERAEQVLDDLGFALWLDKNDGATAPSFVPVRYMEHLNH